MFYVRVFLVGVFTMVLNPCLGRQSRSEGRGITSSGHSLPRSQQPEVIGRLTGRPRPISLPSDRGPGRQN